MPVTYKPPAQWVPPSFHTPSDQFHGEQATASIHEAVGRALSTWEHAESALIKLFQLLCETKSLAACRAYGTLESVRARLLAIEFAAKEFFAARDRNDCKLVLSLLKVFENTTAYRNNIAHGMTVQPHAFGYFLCPPSDSSRRRSTPYPTGLWGLGAKYFYRVIEIDSCRDRFEEILNSTMSLVLYLNNKYKVLDGADFHP